MGNPCKAALHSIKYFFEYYFFSDLYILMQNIGDIMKNLINEMEELKRRFNFEIDKFLIKLKELSEQMEGNSKSLITTHNKDEIEKFVSLKRLCEIYPSFNINGIRHMIFTNKWNFEGECIVRSGRKILIDISKFEAWIRKPKHKDTAYSHLGYGR